MRAVADLRLNVFMEILSHFRTIEELTKTLSREQGLLSEMFEKRKLMKYPQGLALDADYQKMNAILRSTVTWLLRKFNGLVEISGTC